MRRRRCDSIIFVSVFGSEDARAGKVPQGNWRSHAAVAGHVNSRDRVRKPFAIAHKAKHNASPPDPDESGHLNSEPSKAQLATVKDVVSRTQRIYSRFEVPQTSQSRQSCPLILRPGPSLFDNSESANLLQYWMVKAAPFIVRGQCTHLYALSVLVPSISLSSKMVNHIMMAHALTHRARVRAPSEQQTDLDCKALEHYTIAISAMRKPDAEAVEKLLTAYLGWTIEGLQGNLDSSQVHLNGMQALIESGKEDVDIKQRFKPLLAHAKAVQAVMVERLRAAFKIPAERQTMSEGRLYVSGRGYRTGRSYVWIVSYISTSRSRRPTVTQREATINDGIGEWLQVFIRQDSLWRSGQRDPERALRVLNDFVATLLPHDVVAEYKAVDTDNPELVLSTVENCFNPMSQTSWTEYVQLLGTLKILLELGLEVWPAEPWRACFHSMLRAVDVCKRSCSIGR